MTFALFIAPYITFILVLIGVKIISVPVYFKHAAIIKRASKKTKDSRTQFIGITGSYGKTIVKEFVYDLLCTHFRTEKNAENINPDIGVAADILRRLKKDTEFFVTDVGSYKKGEIKQITQFVPFSYAILTGLGYDHLELYGSKEQLIDEETYLLYTIPKKKNVYLNHDIPVRKAIARDIAAKHIYYGLHDNTDISAHIRSTTLNGTKAQIIYNDLQFEIETTIPGKHIIIKLLPAIALSLDLGVPVHKIIKRIKTLHLPLGLQTIVKGKNHSILINSSKEVTFDDFLNGIELINMYSQKEKIIITQGILELGVEKRNAYKRIMGLINSSNITICSTDRLFGEFDHGEQVNTFNDVKSLITTITSKISSETVILIAGRFSKSQLSPLFKQK